MTKYTRDDYEYSMIPHEPTEEELQQYENSDREPNELIKSIMEGRSKEEILLAESNYMRFIRLAERVSSRLALEENKRETVVDKQPKQSGLFR
jgi:hypothetical protein